MNSEYEQIKSVTEIAFNSLVEGGGKDRGLIEGFLAAHRSQKRFCLETGIDVKNGEDRVKLRRDLVLLDRVDLNTTDGRQSAIEYLTIQLKSARELIEVVGRLHLKFDPLRIDVLEEVEEDTPRHIAVFGGAIDFLSSPVS